MDGEYGATGGGDGDRLGRHNAGVVCGDFDEQAAFGCGLQGWSNPATEVLEADVAPQVVDEGGVFGVGVEHDEVVLGAGCVPADVVAVGFGGEAFQSVEFEGA